MSSFIFDGSVWPIDEEWPAGVLPPPCLTVEIAAVELEVLIEHHDDFGAKAAAAHEHEHWTVLVRVGQPQAICASALPILHHIG